MAAIVSCAASQRPRWPVTVLLQRMSVTEWISRDLKCTVPAAVSCDVVRCDVVRCLVV